MKPIEKRVLTAKSDGASGGKRLNLTVADCAVILNFPSKTQDSLMTEIKRMILCGHTRPKV